MLTYATLWTFIVYVRFVVMEIILYMLLHMCRAYGPL